MEPETQLSPDHRGQVEALVAAATSVDGAAPLNEEALLHVRHAGPATGVSHWLATDAGSVVGYAQWQDAAATGQLVVHPEHRRAGRGTALLAALRQRHPEAAVWAFGDTAAAQGFARAAGLRGVRSLLVLERPLTPADASAAPAPGAPSSVTLRGYTAADAQGFLATNAAAFAGHPEQGHFAASDLAARQAEPWWDPAGLLLAVDDEGVAGFHWTKRHDDGTGEVYVLGVHPRAGGRGLGGVLLRAGLAHLAAAGSPRVILYVDAANATAVRLYERAGFTRHHADTLYGPADGTPGPGSPPAGATR
ncbi:mycothiol synthase [Propioniciclava soli]|uniref:Mycothiol acetyltransferase n=1 Tax=Propioniciclava soli TaxID=2775081 RepID=A0ABZ3CBE9_9ACTN